MRYAVLLLSSVLIVGTSAVAQTAPARNPASSASSAKAYATATSAHPMTGAQAEELLRVTHAHAMVKKILSMMLGNLRQQLPPYMPDDVIQDLKAGLENVNFDAMTSSVYRKHLSEEDAAAIIAFDKTPAGQHLIDAMPAIQEEIVLASQQSARHVVTEVFQRHQAEIQAAMKKYEATHSMSSQP